MKTRSCFQQIYLVHIRLCQILKKKKSQGITYVFGGSSLCVVVVDATCLERNLNLVLQILEMTPNVVLCVNLLDEAKKKSIKVDLERLSEILGIPVVRNNCKQEENA